MTGLKLKNGIQPSNFKSRAFEEQNFLSFHVSCQAFKSTDSIAKFSSRKRWWSRASSNKVQITSIRIDWLVSKIQCILFTNKCGVFREQPELAKRDGKLLFLLILVKWIIKSLLNSVSQFERDITTINRPEISWQTSTLICTTTYNLWFPKTKYVNIKFSIFWFEIRLT